VKESDHELQTTKKKEKSTETSKVKLLLLCLLRRPFQHTRSFAPSRHPSFSVSYSSSDRIELQGAWQDQHEKQSELSGKETEPKIVDGIRQAFLSCPKYCRVGKEGNQCRHPPTKDAESRSAI
jgi:hypothetical protein